jgi:hypothetical protein
MQVYCYYSTSGPEQYETHYSNKNLSHFACQPVTLVGGCLPLYEGQVHKYLDHVINLKDQPKPESSNRIQNSHVVQILVRLTFVPRYEVRLTSPKVAHPKAYSGVNEI